MPHRLGPSFFMGPLLWVAPSRVVIRCRAASLSEVVVFLVRLLFRRREGRGQQGLEPQLVAQVRPHAFRSVAAVPVGRGAFDESALRLPAAASSWWRALLAPVLGFSAVGFAVLHVCWSSEC